MLVTAFNPSTDDLEKTFFSQSYNSGVISIQVKNNQAFSNNTRILIGEQGIAQSEIVNCGTPSADGTTLPISATLYSHPANTSVYLLQFDQVQFYRSTNGIGGTYNLLDTVSLDITSENIATNYDDNTALAGYYYEVVMYNSLTGVQSAFSDPIPAVTGWARDQVGHIIDELLTEMNDPTEENITRTEILGYINEVNDDLLLHAVRPFNFLRKRIVLGRTAGSSTLLYPGTGEDTNPEMWKFDHMDYNFVDNTTNPVTNNTYTVEVAPSIEYFRNRWTSNTSSIIVPQNVTAVLAAGGTLTANKTYFYEVTAVYTNLAESGPSTEASLATVTGFGTIDLNWSAVAGASSYNVYRGLSTGGETLLANTAATTYADTGSSGPGGLPGAQQPPATTQDDMVQEIALNETMQEFDYYPTSRTTAEAVWYLYYWTVFNTFLSEGDTIQTPTPRIYKMYVKWAYYLKRSVTEPTYLQMSDRYWQQYMSEKTRLKGHDRRDSGTPRRFEGEGWVRRSFRR